MGRLVVFNITLTPQLGLAKFLKAPSILESECRRIFLTS